MEEVTPDLGWATPKSTKQKRKSKVNLKQSAEDAETLASERRELAAVSANHLSMKIHALTNVFVSAKPYPTAQRALSTSWPRYSITICRT